MISRRLRVDAGGRVWRGRRPVKLRPKARLLVATLSAEPGVIQDRRTLCEAVWGHEHVEPQALFQLVSEIRNAAGDRDCITTYPNRGYAWTVAGRGGSGGSHGSVIAAATALALAVALGAVIGASDVGAPDAGLVASAPPALSAFEHGLALKGAGRSAEAIASLRLAVSEYPRFGLAKLELARLLAADGSSEEAQGFAHDALSDARISDDAYLAASANLLLSHLSWLRGDLARASTRGQAAADIAKREGFLCVAEESRRWNERLALALTNPEMLRTAPPEQQLADCRRAHGVKPQASFLPTAASNTPIG